MGFSELRVQGSGWGTDLEPPPCAQMRRALKADGLFLGSMLGGDTLIELKHAFALADMERTGGYTPYTPHP